MNSIETLPDTDTPAIPDPSPSIGGYHSPADILEDPELDSARAKILGFVELIAPKSATLSIAGIGYVRNIEECRDRIGSMQREQVIAVAKIIPARE